VYYWEGLKHCPHPASWVSGNISELYVRANFFPVLKKWFGTFADRIDSDGSGEQTWTLEAFTNEEPSDDVIKRERAEIVVKAIASLPAPEATMLFKTYFEKCSINEAAQAMGRTSRQGSRLLKSAKNKLKVRLEGQLDLDS
jgi:RNA polymerase sigma factor (sigma-70 family)